MSDAHDIKKAILVTLVLTLIFGVVGRMDCEDEQKRVFIDRTQSTWR